MILKLTLKNRHHSKRLAAFAKALPMCENHYDEPCVSDKIKAKDSFQYEYLKTQIANNTADGNQIADFMQAIKSRFEFFCKDYGFTNYEENEISAMMENFHVDVVATLTHKDEKGEVVYVFLNPYNDTNQIVIL